MDEEEILAQIEELVGQLPPESPAAAALTEALGAGGGEEPPLPSPDGGEEPQGPEEALAAAMGGAPPEEDPRAMAPETEPGSMEEASAMALSDLKKRKQ